MSAVPNCKTLEDGGCTLCHERPVQEQENNVLPGFTDHDSKNLKSRSSEYLANLSHMPPDQLEQSPSANRRSSSLPSFPIHTYKREHLDGTPSQRLNLSDSSDVAPYQSKPRGGDENQEKKSLERDLNKSADALHWNSPVRSILQTRLGLCSADSSEVVLAPSVSEETDSHIRDVGTTLVFFVPPHNEKKSTVYPVTQTRTPAPQSVMQSFRGSNLLRDIQNDCTETISNSGQINFIHPGTCLPRSGESYSEHENRGTSSERQPPPFSRIRTISGYETPSSEEIRRLAREKEARKAEKKREYERSTKRSLFGHIHIAVRIRMPRQYRNRVPRRRLLQWFCCSE